MNPHSITDHDIINHVPIMLFVLSLDPTKGYDLGAIYACNTLASTFIDYTETKMKQMGFHFFREILSPDDQQLIEDIARQLLLGTCQKVEAEFSVWSKKCSEYIRLKVTSSIVYRNKVNTEVHFLNTVVLATDDATVPLFVRNRNSRIITNQLTERNIEFAKLMVAGTSIEKSADIMCVSIPAVKWQRGEIRRKLGFENTVKLLLFLREGGL